MKDIAEKQSLFFTYLKFVQEAAVMVALSKYKEGDSLEDLLFSTTYEVIYDIMLLIDGHATQEIQLDLIDKETGISMRKGIQLHDECAGYMRS